MNIGREFIRALAGYDLSKFENSPNVIYALDSNFRLQYFNKKWEEFAVENNGADLLLKYNIGSSLYEVLVEPLRDYYLDHYHMVINNEKIFQHDFECHSARLFRKFHQKAVPLENQRGLLIENSLVISYPHIYDNPHHHNSNILPYLDKNGLLHQCCNCRKVLNLDIENKWEWNSGFIEKLPENTEYTLCPDCEEYYHPHSAYYH